MSNLFYGINTALNTLRAQSNVLNVTAHNIANANTPGYSRQTVELASVQDDRVNGQRLYGLVTIGSGVEAKLVGRSRFTLYDEIYRKENQNLNFNIEREQLVNQIEVLFAEPSERGFGQILNDFFNSWQDLSNDPQSTAARQSLYSTAEELTERLHRIYSSLVAMRDGADAEISKIPDEINEISKEIADLNDAIRLTESQGAQANDLRDKRDLLVDKLSDYGDVRLVEHDNGTATVLLGSNVLVEQGTVSELYADTTMVDERGLKRTVITSKDGTEYVPKHGKLGALVDFRDNIVLSTLDQIDRMAESLVETINYDHRIGYGLDGRNNRDFFNPVYTKAFNIELSDDISDITHIAASVDGSKGDNANALAINALKYKKVIDDTYTIGEFYNGVVTYLGVTAKEAKGGRQNQELLVTQINNSRESIKGVSIDEELVQMIETQRIYQSASKILSVMDQMLEELVNIK